MKKPKIKFPNRLKEIRDKLGLDVDIVCKTINRDQSTVSRIETGKVELSFDKAVKIANAFNNAVKTANIKASDFYFEGDINLDIFPTKKSAMLRESTPQDDLDREIQEKFKEAKIPCYGAVNAAGETIILNEEGFVEYVDRPPWLAGNPNAFAVRVYGESMGRVYRNGMTVFVAAKKRPAPHDGCVIEMHTGEAYLKEYIGQNDKEVVCQQYNPEKKIKYPIEKVKAIHKVEGTKE